MITSAQVVETSVDVTSNSPSQDYTHPDDHNLPNYSEAYVALNIVSSKHVSEFCHSVVRRVSQNVAQCSTSKKLEKFVAACVAKSRSDFIVSQRLQQQKIACETNCHRML